MGTHRQALTQVFSLQRWSADLPAIHKLQEDRRMQQCLVALLGATGYYAGTKLGFALTPREIPIATLWPPNAILMAVFLLVPVRSWWIVIAAVIPTHFLVQVHSGVPLSTSAGWLLGNVSEALIGAACVRKFVHADLVFESVRGIVLFLLFAVVAAPLATSFVDAATVILTGESRGFWSVWNARLFSNALSELIFVPVIVTLGVKGIAWIWSTAPLRYFEASALALGVVAASTYVFDSRDASLNRIPALMYVPLPFLLWAALRFGAAGLSGCTFLVSLISTQGALLGKGPFSSASPEANVRSLQVLLCTVTASLTVLAAIAAEHRRDTESLREIAQKLITTQEEERKRIARELHDDVGQQLALLQCGLEKMQHEAGTTGTPELEALIARVEQVCESAREISHGLHPSQIEHLGLERAIQRLCEETAARTPLEVKFKARDVSGSVPAETSLCLYRVAQEALQNVVRHSAASRASVTLTQADGMLLLRVRDNGVGFPVDEHLRNGLGLIGMRERLRITRGTFRVLSRVNRGTVVLARVPLPVGPGRSFHDFWD